ncbi:hypothetical protein D7X88_15885 [bacterium C-53]|nr:hypothetical protein [Lachnospiraceae bacterium]NBI04442.1 hypothetical protein [Lachnospiraceae bacterium]RKJ08222.1 hypothetical protein D7X88_15885 [bacterium C-53]
MKIIKALLFFFAGLLLIISGIVLVCALNPDVSKAIAGRLYSEQNEAVDIGISDVPDLERDTSQPLKNEAANVVSENMVLTNEGIDKRIVPEYAAPEESELVIPEVVSGRNGYQQIQGEQQEVTEEEEEQILSRPDYGNTGDGLSFEPVYYPYYAMLDESGKHIYRQIYANADKVYPKFSPVEDVTAGTLRNIFSAVYNDHPELFWLDTAYTGKFSKDGRCVEIGLEFNRTIQDLESAKNLFQENAEQILTGARSLSNQYEQEKFVHDALIDKITYHLKAEMNQSAYSALVNGKTVCAGYARAFQYLLGQLGIPCYYCTGFAGENHAWNIVALEDGYYNVDTTWDDTGDGTYDYFNKTDEDYAGDHIRRELSVYLPPCDGQAFRNLEPEESSLRSLADVGVTEEQVLTNMQDYFTDCYNQIVSQGDGNYTFYNVIGGKDMLEAWNRGYETDFYKQAYMEKAVIETGARSCNMGLSVEQLQGNNYLITHEVEIR